jgi:HSP20 family protein
MANERQSRQQTSERAQTSSPSAQQGEWQPSGQRGAGQQSGGRTTGDYGQFPQTGTRGGGATRRSLEPGYYGGYGGGPVSLMRRLTDDMDRLFESFGMGRGLFGSPFGFGSGQGGVAGLGSQQGMQTLWSPSVDVCERNGKFCVEVDLPGMKKDDVTVQIDNDAIVIQGQRSDERSTNEEGYYQRERSYGSFYRVIPLPEGTSADQATATFRDGVLQIEMPATQQLTRGRKLEIRDAGAGSGAAGTTSTRTSEGGFVNTEGSSGRSAGS